MLRIEGRRVVVVGGGEVAARRIARLVEARASVWVVAPEIDESIRQLDVTIEQRPYQSGDLAGAFLVVAAAGDPAANDAVEADAVAAGVLLNRVDNPEAGHVVMPAYRRVGSITIMVSPSSRLSAMGASMATIRPPSRRATRLQRSASSIRWVATIMVSPPPV